MQALKRISIILFIFVNGYCLTNIITEGAYCNHFRINGSNSLPFYLFSVSPIDTLEREMYVSFTHSLSQQDLFKQIIGLPGDQVCIQDRHVFVNGMESGYIYETSPSGMSLSPIQEGMIPNDFIFVHATHPQSFDSRYAEFGLIAVDQLKERLWPVF